MPKETTVGDVLNTMLEEQKTILYAAMGYAIKGEEIPPRVRLKILDLIDGMNDNQKKVFYYLLSKALDKKDKETAEEWVKQIGGLEVVSDGNI